MAAARASIYSSRTAWFPQKAAARPVPATHTPAAGTAAAAPPAAVAACSAPAAKFATAAAGAAAAKPYTAAAAAGTAGAAAPSTAVAAERGPLTCCPCAAARLSIAISGGVGRWYVSCPALRPAHYAV